MTLSDAADAWNPELYHRFRAERRQPFDDLLGMVEPVPGGRVVDLGCGSGELTAELHLHTQAATTLGIDSSTNMLDRARQHATSGLRFEQGDLAMWRPEAPVDVVFSNASLQWVPRHGDLIERLSGELTAHGQLAIQMPANFDHPSHTIADAVGQEFGMDPVARFEAVRTPEAYAELLDELGFAEVHVRLQVYVHRLPSTASVLDWVQGTLLTRYRRDLAAERYAEFFERYRSDLLLALGDPAGDRPYTHLFKRILLRARR